MAKKQKGKTLGSIIQDLHTEMQLDDKGISSIPDIITFCASPKYLNLEQNGFMPTLAQRIALKIFYRGSANNENLILNDEEIDFIKQNKFDTPEKGDLLNKFNSHSTFRKLILVWGRRSGKDYITSIISSYEAMKLLECPGGDPHKYYKVSPGNPITLLTIASASPQAAIAFNHIKARILSSPYFKDKVVADGVEASKIFLLTKKDKENNTNSYYQTKGTVVVEVGHSNSDSLVGKDLYLLIFDEVAKYKETGGSSSGENMYTALTPGLTTFGRYEIIKDENGDVALDENGQPKKERKIHSKIICISSPRGQEGLLWRLFKESPTDDEALAYRGPTWVINPMYTEKSLRKEFISMSNEDFTMEFGAEFSGTEGTTFFIRDKVTDCFSMQLVNRGVGELGKIYFAHLDPAGTSHNYALVIVHKENVRIRKEEEFNISDEIGEEKEKKPKIDFKIVVDLIKYWHPTPNKPIQITEVDEYVVGLKRKFNLCLVTYDSWNSMQSIEKLKKAGIPAKCTHYGLPYKMAIFGQLEILVNSGQLDIPFDRLLQDEMYCLQRRIISRGFQAVHAVDGDCRTDDVVSALAGAAYQCMNVMAHKLPSGRLVDMGTSSTANSRTWNSMSGPMGTGTGHQVADALENRRGMNQSGIPPSIFRR